MPLVNDADILYEEPQHVNALQNTNAGEIVFQGECQLSSHQHSYKPARLPVAKEAQQHLRPGYRELITSGDPYDLD